MTKEELLKYSSNEIKNSKELLTEFINLYQEEYGRVPVCSSCSLNGEISKWKNKINFKKNNIMSKNKNTFKLKIPTSIYRFQGTKMLTNKATDEIAIQYLNEYKGKYRKERENVFKVLPKSEIKAEIKAETKVETKVETKKEVSPETKAETKKVSKKK